MSYTVLFFKKLIQIHTYNTCMSGYVCMDVRVCVYVRVGMCICMSGYVCMYLRYVYMYEWVGVYVCVGVRVGGS